MLATTKTMQRALGIRNALETLVSNLGKGNFKGLVDKSTLSESDKDLVKQMWDWCNKYMHPQPDGLHPNMLATAGSYESWISGKHKFKAALPILLFEEFCEAVSLRDGPRNLARSYGSFSIVTGGKIVQNKEKSRLFHLFSQSSSRVARCSTSRN